MNSLGNSYYSLSDYCKNNKCGAKTMSKIVQEEKEIYIHCSVTYNRN